MRNYIFAIILLPMNLFADRVVQNEVIRDIYIDNCSMQSGVNICYPQREENIGELIEMFQDCEDQNFGFADESSSCLDVRRRKIAEKQCSMMPANSFVMDSCIEMEMEVISSDEVPVLDGVSIRCEGLYQEVLAQSFSEEFPGLNISFVTGVSEPDFLHNVVYPRSITGSSRDVLLLPEHSNGAFCNDDGNIDINEIQNQIKKSKEIMQTFYETEEFNTALDILEAPQGDLAIMSITCPVGIQEKEEVEVLGQHQRIVSPKPVRVETPTPQPTAEKPQDLDCISDDLKELIRFHQSQQQSSKTIGPTLTGGEDYQLGEGPKRLEYFAPITRPVEPVIAAACQNLDGRLELTSRGAFIDGERVPHGVIIDINGINLNTPDEARYFAEKVNELAEGTDVDDIDGTQVYKAMVAMELINTLKEAKSRASMVAPDGYYLALCGYPADVFEVAEGYYLDWKDCTEIEAPEVIHYPGMGPYSTSGGDQNPFMPTDESQEVDSEYDEAGGGYFPEDFNGDTGGW